MKIEIFGGHVVSQITYTVSNTSVSTSIMTMIPNFAIFFDSASKFLLYKGHRPYPICHAKPQNDVFISN